ncbi:uncharacterized protein LOC106463653 [Limulus polyphemus]|uniref:Uncharacterized protein LOC106463653 n=1 Tax=Limulus polyphemus TaxID=6850 RepID=A0ABM1BCD1_LIMPO|nr:uncharacterized protein LOC106463653 [Limulus polyphemus]
MASSGYLAALFILLSVIITQARVPLQKRQTGNANDYIDKVLENARKHFRENNMDPLPLPEAFEGFSKKILFVTLSGDVKAWDGFVQGLSRLNRAGDITLRYEGGTIFLSGSLGIDKLSAGYTARARLGKLAPTIKVQAWIAYISVSLGVQIPSDGSPGYVNHLDIHNIGKIDIKIDGLIPLNYLLTAISFVFLNIFKNVLKKAFIPPITNAINGALRQIDMPFGFL